MKKAAQIFFLLSFISLLTLYFPQKDIFAQKNSLSLFESTAAGRNNLQSFESTATSQIKDKLEKLTFKLIALLERIEKINEKISTRLLKMEENSLKIAKPKNQALQIDKQIESLKQEILRFKELSDKGITKENYKLGKTMMQTIRKSLNDILLQEKNLVLQMKKMEK